jgi:succinate dehydrogenase flavin-adding protein (antitoxin of CptAB toxin-antitoxin module)
MNTNFSAFDIRFNIVGVENISEEKIIQILTSAFDSDIILSHNIKKYSPSYKKSNGKKALRKILLKRDGDLCHWCKKPIEFSFEDNHPLSCSIEHIKRRSEGGSVNGLDNLALAHKVCNETRHNKK